MRKTRRGNLFSKNLLQQALYPLLLGVCLCLAFPSGAQWEGMVFSHLGKENGLSSSQVNTIIQDKKGYLWFGTADGLNRYDGQNVKVYPFDPNDPHSFYSGEVLSFGQSDSGMLWVGAREGILSAYVPEEDQFYRYEVPKNDTLTQTSIWAIATDGDSVVWLALEQGLARFSRKTSAFEYWRPTFELPELGHDWFDVVYGIAEDNTDPNVLWLATRRGILRFFKNEKKFKHRPFEGATSNFFAARQFHFEGDSIVWLAAERGSVIRFNKKTWAWRQYPLPYLTQVTTYFLLPDPGGGFWAGLPDHGFGYFDVPSGSFTLLKDAHFQHPSLPTGSCLSGILDKDGRLWLGTENGVFWTYPNRRPFRHYLLEPAKSRLRKSFFVEDVVEMDGGSSYLAATRLGDGIYILNKKSGKVEEVISQIAGSSAKPGEVIFFKLIKMDGGRIFVASDHGLLELDLPGKKLFYPPQFDVPWKKNAVFHCMKKHPDGSVFALNRSPRGLLHIPPGGRGWRFYTFENSAQLGFPPFASCNDLSFDREGNVWIFGNPAVVKFDRKKERFEVIRCGEEENCQGGAWASCGATDRQGRVWAGYEAGGLDCYDSQRPAGQQFRHFSVNDGLPGNKVYELATDGRNNLWVATNNGLSRLGLETLAFENFSEKDGLIKDNLGAQWVDALEVLESGEVFIGGHDFFTLLDPEQLPEASGPPDIVFNDFFVFDQVRRLEKSLEFTENITLQPDENFFTLTFAALSYTRPELNRYRYLLEDYDKNWRESAEGKASYTNVPPGNYRFKVMAANHAGVWNEEGKTLAIRILPPFYATWWFRGIAAGVLAMVVWAGYRWRIHQVRRQEQLKAEYERQLTDMEIKALRSQMNPHFLFNSLNSIKNYIVQNEQRLAARYLTKFSQLMRLILNNSRNTAVTLEDELKALELYVELESLRFRDKFDFEFDIEPGLPAESIYIPPLVIQPYVENAIWHGLMHKNEKGKLWVRIHRKNAALQIEIEDNGVGRKRARELRSKTATKDKSMGMQITGDRLALVKNTNGATPAITIEDLVDSRGEPCGTLVVIQIPLHENN